LCPAGISIRRWGMTRYDRALEGRLKGLGTSPSDALTATWTTLRLPNPMIARTSRIE